MKTQDAQLRFSLIASTLMLLGATDLAFGDKSMTEPQPKFVIICFPGPPATDNRVEHYEKIRQANFNVVLPLHRYDDEQQMKMLDHCQATGLRGVVNVKRLAPPVAEGPAPSNWNELVQSAVKRFAEHPALYGYMIRDEPNAAVFPQLGRVAREFRQRDPDHDICVNLFPIYATREQLGVASYEAYLDEFLSTVKPPALCYDHYPFMLHAEDRQDYFHNLEVARRACLKHDTPLWIVVLSNWWQHFRTPTDAELRWQAYGALAYGIRGIAYFTYWPVKNNYAAVVDYQGNPQPLYQSIQRLNGELDVLGRQLAALQSVGVYHTGRDIPVGCRRLPDDNWLGPQGNPPLVIGLFRSKSEARYVLLTNRNSKQTETVTLRLPPGVSAVSVADSTTGQFKELTLQGRACQIALPAGTGKLLSLR